MNDKRLWECTHSYYCTGQNYYTSTPTTEVWQSWADFYEEFKDADDDYNMLFRWDWIIVDEDDDCDPCTPYNQLHLFFMIQRKGYHFEHVIHITPDDEPAIKAYLIEKYAHLKSLWEPLS